jgi:hypothetical protein
MTTGRRTILQSLIYVVLVPLVEGMMRLLHIPEILGEHAIVSWIDDQIAEELGFKSPTINQVVGFVVTWGPAALFAVLLLAAGWIVVTNAIAKRAKPPSGTTQDLWTNRDAVERVGPSANQGPLRIEVGEAGGFFETKRGRSQSLYTHMRILKLRISNTDHHRPLTGCRIYVTDIEPHEYEGPWLLKEGFSLAAGDHEFVPLASYTEPDNVKISAYGATFMEILATQNRPKPSSSVQHVLTIRATALGSSFCEIKCKLWIDDTGRLRIDYADRPAKSDTNVATVEPTMPHNAQFMYKGKVYWVVPRRYTKDEADDMRRSLREVYDCINLKSAPIVANYDGPAVMFTRNWTSIIQEQGPSVARAMLDDIRTRVRAAHVELQEIVSRKPYYRQDIMTIVGDSGGAGSMNGALNNYIDALDTLPEKPNTDLIKLAIGPVEDNFAKAIAGYTEWIAAFNTKMMLVKGELEALSG